MSSSPAAVLLSALLLVPVRASAHGRPLAEAITVAQAGECLGAASLIGHLGAWLERAHIDPRLAVVVRETPDGAAFEVFRDGQPVSSRSFSSLPHDCADRRAAVSLAIALAIDAAVLDALVPEGEEVAPAPEEPPAEVAAPVPPVAIELAAEVQVLFEVLPEVAAAWQIGPRVVFWRLLELGLSAWFTSVSGAALQPGRVDIQLFGVRADVCLRRPDVVTLRGCLGLASGAARGLGRDLPRGYETMLPYLGLFGRVAIAITLLDMLALEVSADGWLALLRPRFNLDDDGTALSSATLPLGGGAAAVGLVLHF